MTWTSAENKEIEKYFEKIIEKDKPKMPNKDQIRKFMDSSKCKFKGYMVVKNKVNSIYQRYKRRATIAK